MRKTRRLLLLPFLLALACSTTPTRDLSDLVLQDSTYYTPETMGLYPPCPES